MSIITRYAIIVHNMVVNAPVNSVKLAVIEINTRERLTKITLIKFKFCIESIIKDRSVSLILSRSLILFCFFFLLFSFFFANTEALIVGCGPTTTITCLAASGSKALSPEGLVRRRTALEAPSAP